MLISSVISLRLFIQPTPPSPDHHHHHHHHHHCPPTLPPKRHSIIPERFRDLFPPECLQLSRRRRGLASVRVSIASITGFRGGRTSCTSRTLIAITPWGTTSTPPRPKISFPTIGISARARSNRASRVFARARGRLTPARFLNNFFDDGNFWHVMDHDARLCWCFDDSHWVSLRSGRLLYDDFWSGRGSGSLLEDSDYRGWGGGGNVGWRDGLRRHTKADLGLSVV